MVALLLGWLIGQVGRLRLPRGARDRGLVRLSVRGTVMDVPAYSSGEPLHRGLPPRIPHGRPSLPHRPRGS